MGLAWASVVTLAQAESIANEKYKIAKGPFEPISESLKSYQVPQWYEESASRSCGNKQTMLFVVTFPEAKPCRYAYVLKIRTKDKLL